MSSASPPLRSFTSTAPFSSERGLTVTRTGKPSTRAVLQEIADDVVGRGATATEFIERLEERGVQVVPYIDEKDEVKGVSYRLDGGLGGLDLLAHQCGEHLACGLCRDLGGAHDGRVSLVRRPFRTGCGGARRALSSEVPMPSAVRRASGAGEDPALAAIAWDQVMTGDSLRARKSLMRMRIDRSIV